MGWQSARFSFTHHPISAQTALVAKLVDAPDLGSGGFGRVGSSPIRRTEMIERQMAIIGCLAFYLCSESKRRPV